MVFRGGPIVTMDGKGRITVPARWREVLMASEQGRLVVAKNPDRCLTLFPIPMWEQFENKILELAAGDEAWRRFFVGSATDIEIDSASRLLIPPELRAWAGLEEKVKFIGVGAYFELWDMARQEADEAQTLARGRPEALRNLVLR
jgi:MraZ protein